MKILLINNYHFRHGGSETVYFNTADLLAKHGHDVIFYSQKRLDNIPCEQSNYFCDAIDLNTKGFINKVKGVKHYFYNKDAAIGLNNLLKVESPDVAHLHIFLCGLTMSVVDVLNKHHIPIVNSVHEYRMICPAYTFKDGNNNICEKCGSGNYINCIKRKCSKGNYLLSTIMAAEMYYRNIFHHPAKKIDAFIFVSNFCKNIHLKYDRLFAKKTCKVLYNFRNSDVIENIELGLQTYNSYYLYYGRLSFEKGVKTIIDAFSSFPEETLKIVGKGPIANELQNFCKRKRLNNIEFLGFKTGKELYSLISNAKFVVVPSEWYENNPMTIIESYSLRTPVIGASIGGITEIIREGITGYLFKSGSKKDFSNVLKKCNSLSKEDYIRLKENAEYFSNENFDSEKHYNRLIEIYSAVIK